MSRIKGKDTKPEIAVRQSLHRRGFRFRVDGAGLKGRPDLVLKKYGAVIFVHGCFWHAHDCPLHRVPSTRREFWSRKFEQNRIRDSEAVAELHQKDWRTCIVWECALRGKQKLGIDEVTEAIADWLSSSLEHLEIRGLL